jgi:hypothetical protein
MEAAAAKISVSPANLRSMVNLLVFSIIHHGAGVVETFAGRP